jgi:hypothetical protein
MKKNVLVDLCKCKYCGAYVIICNDHGKCPRGCPGFMSTIQSSLFEIDTEKSFHHNIELKGNFRPDNEYDNIRDIVTKE